MKTPREFDYDIWKDENGDYYVRIKRTGETARVSKEVVRELWMELYRMRKHRENNTITDENGNTHNRLLSLNSSGTVRGENRDSAEKDPWTVDKTDPFASVEFRLLEDEFLKCLTERQLEVYILRFKEQRTIPECARLNGMSVNAINRQIAAIRKKAKNFF